MAGFKRGDTVRRIANGQGFFPVGATALIFQSNVGGSHVVVSVNGKYDGYDDGAHWYIPASDLELVTPAEPAQQKRTVVQTVICRADSDYIKAALTCNDGAVFIYCEYRGTLTQVPDVPQPEPTP